MNTRSRHIIICLLALVLWQGPSALSAVSPVQVLIDVAAPGDTILVPQGFYRGNLRINKKLVVLGQNDPVILGDGNTHCIEITADSCVLTGFIIEHSGGNLMDDHAGIMIRSRGNRIEHNTLRDILFGIYLYRAHYNIIRYNSIRGRSELGLGQRGSGIHIWDSYYNTLTDNIITEARDGFYIEYANNTLIARNEVFNLRYGLHYMYADTNVFLQNTFYDNVAGAAIMYSQCITFRHNVFAHNRGYSSYGILFQDCHFMHADSNVIADNVVGMFFEATTDNYFRHNIIAQNDIALNMFQNSVNNTFTENNFIDNLSPLTLIGRQTESRWSEGGRGNYWSAYDGYDLNNDGIGDVPMKIQNVFQYLEGKNANLRLYLYSPASQALATSAKAFPIIAVNTEEDRHPLMEPVPLQHVPAVKRMTMFASRNPDTAPDRLPLLLALPIGGMFGIALIYHRLARKG